MFVAVVLLFLLCQTNGDDSEVRYRCRDDANATNTNVTFTPSVDGVRGRYTVELCTLRNPNVTRWNIDLWYFVDPARCRSARKPDQLHSMFKGDIHDPNNCSHVCYSLDFDLIFAGCYNIHSEFEMNKRMLRPIDTYITINNDLTLDMYQRNKPHVSFIPNHKMVSLHWYLGLPVTNYEVSVSSKKADSNEYSERRLVVSENCSRVTWNEVRCQLWLPLGCYQATFQHESLWASLLNEQTEVIYPYCHVAAGPPVVWGGSARALWACGGALLAAAALAASALARRALRTRTYHKHVLEAWRRARECEVPGGGAAAPVEARAHNIVVLYAREGERAQRAVDALKALLRHATAGEVLDLFSPETTARAAAAPGTWLRDALLAPHCRVLLLQSPATAALYSTNLQHNTLNLSSPLLGRRALYRAPHFGDQLLQLALRLVAEHAAGHHDYNKYYLATYESLETDILQQVVPYRRYVLPAAAPALLRDLAPEAPSPSPSPAPALLQRFADAAGDFVAHARAKPEYLLDELVVM